MEHRQLSKFDSMAQRAIQEEKARTDQNISHKPKPSSWRDSKLYRWANDFLKGKPKNRSNDETQEIISERTNPEFFNALQKLREKLHNGEITRENFRELYSDLIRTVQNR